MANDKRSYEDDGRTIADMSGIESQPMFLPRSRKRRRELLEPESSHSKRPWEESGKFSREERHAAMFGALKASLLIAGVYIVGLGLAIWALLALWR